MANPSSILIIKLKCNNLAVNFSVFVVEGLGMCFKNWILLANFNHLLPGQQSRHLFNVMCIHKLHLIYYIIIIYHINIERCTNRFLRTPINIFIWNLASADLLAILLFPWINLCTDLYQMYILGAVSYMHARMHARNAHVVFFTCGRSVLIHLGKFRYR